MHTFGQRSILCNRDMAPSTCVLLLVVASPYNGNISKCVLISNRFSGCDKDIVLCYMLYFSLVFFLTHFLLCPYFWNLLSFGARIFRAQSCMHVYRRRSVYGAVVLLLLSVNNNKKIPKITSRWICIANKSRANDLCMYIASHIFASKQSSTLSLYSNWITRSKSLHFSY